MSTRILYFASRGYWRTGADGLIPDGAERWRSDLRLSDALAERALESISRAR